MTRAERLRRMIVGGAERWLSAERRERLALDLVTSLRRNPISDMWREQGVHIALTDGGDHEGLAIGMVRSQGPLNFRRWQRAGFNVMPNHYYSPEPDLDALPDSVFSRLSELPGIDMRAEEQIELLRTLAAEFHSEYDALPLTSGAAGPGRFYVDNGAFGPIDAELLYAMVRRFKPKRIVEIGSGWSTLCAEAAVVRNAAEGYAGEILAYEPFPYEVFVEAVARSSVIAHKQVELQQVPLSAFESLSANDILFIDSSHMAKIGSDVLYEFLEILPRLAPGVIVHVHDVFLPAEYPREWVVDEQRFWNEQYLLQAFLCFNRGYEVMLAAGYLRRRYVDALSNAFVKHDASRHSPGSFWMRRR